MDRFKVKAKTVSRNSDANSHSSQSSGRGTTRHETLQALLTNARDALDIAKELAPLIPVPFLSSLFASAKVIVDASSQVVQNKQGCAELAQRVATIVKQVRKEIWGKENLVDKSLAMALQQLNADFTEIRDLMLAEVKRGTFSRLLHREDIASRIQELGTRVNDSMQTFQSTSSIRLEVKLEKVSQDVSNIDSRLAIMDGRSRAERKWDGQFRIYRLGEIREGRYISSEQRTLFKSKDMTDGDVVEETLLSASIKGRVVAVKKFRGPNYVFQETLNALKRARHENVAQLEGYSDQDSDIRFLVFKGKLRRFDEYMTAMISVEERYNLYVQGMMSMLSGHYHLVSQRLHWLGKLEDLMIDESTGAVVLGALDDFIHQYSSVAPENDSMATHSSSPLVRLIESLPTLVRDWDQMRVMAAYLPNSYYPILYPAEEDPARQEYFNSVAYVEPGSWLTADERALIRLRDALVERVNTDGYWYSTSRSSRRRIGTIGSIVIFESGLSYDKEAEDFAAVDCVSVRGCETRWGGREEDSSEVLSVKSEQQYTSETGAEIDEAVAWSLLVKYGPAIAREHGVSLRNLGIKAIETNTAMLQFRRAPGYPSHSDQPMAKLDSEEESTLTFHYNYDSQSGSYGEPWGYFLFDDDPLREGISLPMEPYDGAWADFSRAGKYSKEDEECEEIGDPEGELQGSEYRSTLEGIHAVTKQRSYATFVMLYEDQADMLEWANSLSFSRSRIEYRQKTLYTR